MSDDTAPECTIDGTTNCRSRLGCSKRRWWKLCCTDMPRGLCVFMTLTGCQRSTISYYCASSAFGARIVSDTKFYCIRRHSRGPIPNASKRLSGSINLGSSGPLFCKAMEGSQSGSCLGGLRCKGSSEEINWRCLGGTASRKP